MKGNSTRGEKVFFKIYILENYINIVFFVFDYYTTFYDS